MKKQKTETEQKQTVKQIDYAAFEQEAMQALYENPDKLTGKEGVLNKLYKQLLEKAMEAELDHHMIYEEADIKNRKNGKMSKTVRTAHGSFELNTPRDRQGNFEPQIVRKRQVFLGAEIEHGRFSRTSHIPPTSR